VALTPGTRIGSYEIAVQIGVGGMGEVYRAADAKLGRDVAIKVLPDSVAQDSERLARFDREARTLASLNHPNIAAIYGLEDADGSKALVMELVEGPTLADRIAEGAIPVDEALGIARQIAEALEAAHEQGIVHRDLKPANVKVRPDGTVKVLDFGLAKAMEPAAAMSPGLSQSPTITTPAMTQAGLILGTAAYMAPEQARGRPVDRRADIWAFGVLLYEMVTGRKLFAGEDLTETLAFIVTKAPELSAAPWQLRRLLARCLAKDPRNRLRDIGDVWDLLADKDQPEVAQLPPVARRQWLWPAIAVLGTILAGGVATWAPWREAPEPPDLVKFEISPPDGSAIGKFALSPDGRKIAYFINGGEDAGLWVRALDDLAPVRIGGSFGPVIPSFFWSPDSRFVAFPAGATSNRLVRADAEGGPPDTLAEVSTTVAGGSWGADGTILFGSLVPGVWRMQVAGGEPVQLTTNDPSRPAFGHVSPILLPDGEHFLYTVIALSPGDSGVFVASLDADEQDHQRIVATSAAAGFVPLPDGETGYLLFLREDALLAQELDLNRFELQGTPTRLATGVGSEVEFGAFSASNTGALAYHRTSMLGADQLTVRWIDRDGELGPEVTGSLSSGSLYFDGGVQLSPDGSRAAVGRRDPEGEDIWLVDFARNNGFSRLTSGPARHRHPVWSPDGDQIAYLSVTDQGSAVAKRASNTSGPEQIVLEANGKDRDLNDWSDDGRFLLFAQQDEATKSDLWVVPADGSGEPEVFLNSAFNETQGQFSPDGHWIAYVSDETGQPEVYIQPFPQGNREAGKIPISNVRGVMPRWSQDGKELFYLGIGGVSAVDFTSTPVASASVPQALFQSVIVGNEQRTYLWDAAPAGDRFLLTMIPVDEGSTEPLTVVLNWERMLEK